MTNDIRVIIGFVILLIAVCKIWNMYAMKQYEKSKEKSLGLTYGFYGNIEKPEIVGVGNDMNEDYNVVQAIKKVDLPDNVRIKVYE